MVTQIVLTVENAKNELTAKQAYALAKSWTNEELARARSVILQKIEEVAKQGGLSTHVYIKSDRPSHFYTTLKEQMQALGYRVTHAESNRDGGTWWFYWTE